ncbi:hypothetical protein B0T16DRAFT_384874 [Cercophora newfieldiana]|uniref:HMG box domain-containing protein n=1 Tax=Cercophora newfieldiana TaxID=92897 RepID=A0AA39YQM9_9PEZI|nr:hypothetical protein B0T16DRAFT_384874 [Cercophora newfieldiana]
MWSAIGLATHLRVAGTRLAVPIARKAATAPATFFRRTTIHGTVVVRRGFAATRACPAAAATEGMVRKTKASATKKPAAKKPAAKKKLAAKKKPVKKKKPVAKKKPAKKELSETAKKTLLSRSVTELKQLALYGEVPKASGDSAWKLVLSQRLKGFGKGFSSSDISELSQQFHSLPAAERAQLNLEADQNKAANQSAYRAWVESKKPEDILVANYARTALKRVGERLSNVQLDSAKLSPIVDKRLPKRPANVKALYIRARHESGDLVNVPFEEVSRRLGTEWAGLTDAERKPFFDAVEASVAEYDKVMNSLLGPDWQQVRNAQRNIVRRVETRISRLSNTPEPSPSPSP